MLCYLPSSVNSEATWYRLTVVIPDGSPCGRATRIQCNLSDERMTPGAHRPDYRSPNRPRRCLETSLGTESGTLRVPPFTTIGLEIPGRASGYYP